MSLTRLPLTRADLHSKNDLTGQLTRAAVRSGLSAQ